MKSEFKPFCTTLNFSGETASFFYSSHITPLHSHNTMQLVFDLKNTFIFRTEHTKWEKFTGLIIRENVTHQLNTNQSLQLIIYLDPYSAMAQQFKYGYLGDNDFCGFSLEFTPLEEILIYQNLIKTETKSVQLLIQLIFDQLNEFKNQARYSERLTHVLQLIKKINPAELSIDHLASKVFISPSRLRMQFKQISGISLHSYIIKYKILTAITLIINGLSIQDAAYESGFNDGSHLNKMMRKTFAINPSMFIKENRHFSINRDNNTFELKTKRAYQAE